MTPMGEQDPPAIQIVQRRIARATQSSGAQIGPRLEGKAGQIFDEVEKRLATGVHPFGSEIVTADLVREFSASRAPVTMAMNLLQAAGYVIIRPQVGVRVVSPTDEEIVDFFRLYARSEELHTCNATRRATPETLAILDLIEEQMEQVEAARGPGVAREILTLSALFHSQIRAMAATPWLCQHSASAWRMANFLTANRPAADGSVRRDWANASRRQIIALMKLGDASGAGRAMGQFVMGRCTIADAAARELD